MYSSNAELWLMFTKASVVLCFRRSVFMICISHLCFSPTPPKTELRSGKWGCSHNIEFSLESFHLTGHSFGTLLLVCRSSSDFNWSLNIAKYDSLITFPYKKWAKNKLTPHYTLNHHFSCTLIFGRRESLVRIGFRPVS